MKTKLSILLLVASAMFACTDDDGSRCALQGMGFTNVQLTGYSYFGCGKDDSFSTGFTATNPQGNQVSGVVCCGIMKNCTVRF